MVVSVHHLKTQGKAMGPYVWQVHGAKAQKGSCFCESSPSCISVREAEGREERAD